jgi:hypothetical protein
MFLRNVGLLSTGYTALYRSRRTDAAMGVLVAVAVVVGLVLTNESSCVYLESAYHKNLVLCGHRFIYCNET